MQIGFNLEKMINGIEDKLAIKKARIVFICKACKQKHKHNAYNRACKRTDAVNSLIRKLGLAKIRLLSTKRREAFADIKQIPSRIYKAMLDWISSFEYRKLGRVSLSCVLCLSLIIGCSVSGFALDDAITPEKEEVVYVNLNADGSVDEIYVVNIFNLNEEGEIIDYGAYEEVRNMSSNDEISLENKKVVIYTDEQKLYYEGLIKGNALPWVFDIHYFLNDVELDAEDLGGKTGALRIELGITKNEDSSLGFFENYCLQINLTLDTDNAKNIVAEGATIANVGSNKQITYVALPNQEHNYEITADVEKFTMSGFEINGLKMNVGLTEIDSSVFTSDMEKLEDGVTKLANGAAKLADGAGQLSGGAADLLASVGTLRSGVAALKDGAAQLATGTKSLRDGTEALATGAWSFENQVESGIAGISNSIDTLVSKGADELEASLSKYGNIDYAELLNKSINSDTILQLLKDNTGSEVILGLLLKAVNTELTKYPDPNSPINKMLSHMAFILEYKLANAEEIESVIKKYYSYIERFVVIAENSEYILEAGGINAARDYIDQIIAENHDECKKVLDEVVKAFINQIMSNEIVTMLLNTLMTSISQDIAETIGTYAAGLSSQFELIATGLVSELLYGVSQIGNAAYSLYDGANAIYSGAYTLNSGLGEALSGVDALKSGAKLLYDGTVTLEDSCIQLKNGAEELRLAVYSSGQGLTSKIIKAIEDIFGADFVAPSFTDERNESINFVQFVLKTQSIVPPGLEEDNTAAQQTTFWARFMKLFGVERREGAVND